MSSDYPSLSPRPIEDVSFAEPEVRPPPPATPAAAAQARYAPIVARARKADTAFETKLAEARAAIAAGRGAPVGSAAWATAQQALSRLQIARAPVAAALADLQAAGEADGGRGDPGLATAAGEALASVARIDAGEAQALAALSPDG